LVFSGPGTTSSWSDASLTCTDNGYDFARITTVAEQHQFMTKFNDTAQQHWVWINARSPWVLRTNIGGAIGDGNDDTEGAGITMADIDSDGTEDLIELHIWDSNNDNDKENYAHYSIGWNPDENGNPTGWSERISIGAGVGKENQGGGITAGLINDNNITDLVVFYIHNPAGTNRGYYRIGWDIDESTGEAVSWTDSIEVPNLSQTAADTLAEEYFFTSASAGGGIAIKDITGNGRPELIVYNISKHSGANNRDRYAIGWDIDSATGSATHWNFPAIIGNTTLENHGGGISIEDIDGDGKLDLITYFIAGIDGANHAYYRIGLGIGNNGAIPIDSWTHYRANTDVGDITRFAGLAIGDIDNSGRPDMIVASVMGSYPNEFRYAVARNISEEGKLVTQHLDANGTLVGEDE
jgi:hypothetical protein